MRIIILSDKLSHSRSLSFDRRWLAFAVVTLVLMVFGLLAQSYVLHDRSIRIAAAQQQIDQLKKEILFDQQKIQNFYSYSNGVFQEQAKQAGLLQARIARLESLGSRLADRASFGDEFDFYSLPAVGGPYETQSTEVLGQADIKQTLLDLNVYLDRREQELKAIDGLLNNQRLQKESYIAGRPAASGWVSSNFGKRIDPFTGRVAWHRGIDYAGKMGTDVTVVAAGVVVWAGERYGYGNLVEVNHGNGFATRYAHSGKIHVKMGDIVSKGQTIAEMGSTGRSTGPHVHFEVLKNGRAVDPRNYIYRKSL